MNLFFSCFLALVLSAFCQLIREKTICVLLFWILIFWNKILLKQVNLSKKIHLIWIKQNKLCFFFGGGEKNKTKLCPENSKNTTNLFYMFEVRFLRFLIYLKMIFWKFLKFPNTTWWKQGIDSPAKGLYSGTSGISWNIRWIQKKTIWAKKLLIGSKTLL